MKRPDRHWHRRAAGGALAALVFLASAGCGSGMYPVQGKIVYADGKPATELAGGTVLFENPEARVSAMGEISKGATFQLTSTKKNDGAPPGTYRVAIGAPDPDEGKVQDDTPKSKRRKSPVAEKYRNMETSGLRVTVERKKNEVTLTLDRPRRPPPRSGTAGFIRWLRTCRKPLGLRDVSAEGPGGRPAGRPGPAPGRPTQGPGCPRGPRAPLAPGAARLPARKPD